MINQLIEYITKGAAIVGALTVLIEASPVPLHPLRWFGNRLNYGIRSDLEAHIKSGDKKEMKRLRYQILEFGSSCMKNELHSKDEFEHIIDVAKDYHELIDKYAMTNGLIDIEYDFIVKNYEKCKIENCFLK